VCPRSGAAPVAEAVAVIELLDERIAALDRELGPLARADRRVSLLGTIPGIGPLLGLTIAAEIGDVARFQSPPKLTGYSGLAPRVKQSGQRSRSGELWKAGSRMLRFAAVEAAQGAWRETNPWHRLYSDAKARTGKANPAKSAVARKVLIARRHVLSREQPFKPRHPKQTLSRPAPPAFWPPTARTRIEKPGQLPSQMVRQRAPKQKRALLNARRKELTSPNRSKRKK
jgi:transposase